MRRLSIVGVVAATALLAFNVQTRAEESPSQPRVFTAAQAEAGRKAYQSVCVYCHADSLRGRNDAAADEPPLVSSLSDEWQGTVRKMSPIPPLVGPAFMAKWATTKDLATRVDVAIGGFAPKDLDETTYLSLTAYLLQMNGAEPGPEKLTSQTAVVIQTLLPAHKR